MEIDLNPQAARARLLPRSAADRVLDAFYLQDRVLPEAEYAPLREAMRHPAVLLLGCPDGASHADSVTGFFARHDSELLSVHQHRDLGMLMMRVAWRARGEACPEGFGRRFSALAQAIDAQWQVRLRRPRERIAIFVSRELHCLQDLLQRHRHGELPCEIALIVSNHEDARPLADAHRIPFRAFAIDAANKAEAERQQVELMREQRVDLVVLARYMQVLSPAFVRAYPHAIINVHHSLLPAFAGARPYRRAFERGVRIIGATSHYVTEGLDEGPIIEQEATRVPHRSAFERFLELGHVLEAKVLYRAVRWHLEHRVLVYGGKTVVFDAAHDDEREPELPIRMPAPRRAMAAA